MDEYREVVKEFYRVYRPLQKKHNLRMHSRFSIYDDGLIEIWEYTGEQRGKCVCKVKEEKAAGTGARAGSRNGIAERLRFYDCGR